MDFAVGAYFLEDFYISFKYVVISPLIQQSFRFLLKHRPINIFTILYPIEELFFDHLLLNQSFDAQMGRLLRRYVIVIFDINFWILIYKLCSLLILSRHRFEILRDLIEIEAEVRYILIKCHKLASLTSIFFFIYSRLWCRRWLHILILL